MKNPPMSPKKLRVIANRLLREIGVSDFANPASKEQVDSAMEAIRGLEKQHG